MAPPNHRRSTGIERRASTRASMQLSIHEHMDEDAYGLEAMGIADGFRPTNIPAAHDRSAFSSSQNDYVPARRSTPPPRPSSTTKPNYADNFALRHDGPTASTPAPMRSPLLASSSSMSTLTRTSSVSSENTIVRSESPYQGPAGPSHPYQMYPQSTRPARTASIATTSTFPTAEERGYNGPNGPAHPYRMYPQNTVPEAETEADIIQPVPAIPVGFPGHGGNYQRRLGPDGEEAADLIGPDGHTEQLPPYTRYPDEAFARKVASLPPATITAAGAGGIGLATRNPEFESREDLGGFPSRQSTRSVVSERSDGSINGAARRVSEKPVEKKWKRVARRKVCGLIPIWVLVLVGAVILLFLLIVGAVLGWLKNKAMAKSVPHKPAPGTPVTITTTFDATPVKSLPTGFPSLPTGSWSLQIPVPEIAQQNCLENTLQVSSWSCTVPMITLTMTVNPIDGSKVNNNEVFIRSPDAVQSQILYGTQPPIFASKHALSLVSSNDDTRLGMAWFFQVPYDKLVIVPESSSLSANAKRDSSWSSGSPIKRKNVAVPGDRPWFCYWNQTLLETFIYPNATSVAGYSQAAAAASSATETPTPTPTPHYPEPSKRAIYIPGPSTPADVAPRSVPTGPVVLPGYPKVVKIQERRLSFSAQPYCVQMLVAADSLSVTPYINASGQQPTIILDEIASNYPPSSKVRRGEPLPLDTRDFEILLPRQSSNSCTCVWRVT